MFKRFRRIMAGAAVCVLVTGIAAYAQTQPPKQQRPAAQAGIQQNAQQVDPQGAAQRMRARARLGFGSLQGALMPPNPQMVQRLAERLGLTDQQKEQIKQLYAAFSNTVKPIREQRLQAVKAFMAAFRSPNVSKEELQRLAAPIQQADQAILDAEFDFWIGFRPILNQQQQAQLQTLMLQKAGQEFGDLHGTPAGPRPKGNPARPAK